MNIVKYKSELGEDWIEYIKSKVSHLKQATLGYDGQSDHTNYRSSEVCWIVDNDINNLIDRCAYKANRSDYGFNLSHMQRDIQFARYDSKYEGHYNWHIDTFWGNPSKFDRKLTVIVQLSDSNDYEGGDLLIDNTNSFTEQVSNLNDIREKGTVIVFPSFLRHKVTPVTSGVRESLVSWIEGPKFV
jgi:PKHD-type hydroxylase